MVNDIWVATLANLLAGGMLGLASIGLSLAFFVRKRRALFRFFGLGGFGAGGPGMSVLVSRLEIEAGGSRGFWKVGDGYAGPAMTRSELVAAFDVKSLFDSWLLAHVPTSIKQWMARRRAYLQAFSPAIDVSPLAPDVHGTQALADAAERENQVLVLIGSPVYNALTGHYLDRAGSPFRFFRRPAQKGEGRVMALSIDDGTGSTEVMGREHDRELGIVYRFREPDRKPPALVAPGSTQVFVCAGLGSSATFGCVEYLVSNWRLLDETYGQADFGICLGFADQSPDCRGDRGEVKAPDVVWERSLAQLEQPVRIERARR